MVIELEVEDFLAHHGVKGQRWGVRNKKKSKYFAPTTKEERQAIRRSPSAHQGRVVLGKVAAELAVGFGSHILAYKLLRKNHNRAVSQLGGFAAGYAGGTLAQKILGINGTRKAKSLKKKNTKANADLKELEKIEKSPKIQKELRDLDKLFRESKFKTVKQMGPSKTKRLNDLANKHMA